MAALVIADLALQQEARIQSATPYRMLGKAGPQATEAMKVHMEVRLFTTP
jgi:hypothetical protein